MADGVCRRQWKGILELQRWQVPAKEQLREDIEFLAEKRINRTTPMGDTEAFCDLVQKVDALLQRSDKEEESGRLQLGCKLGTVLHKLLQMDANTQQDLQQRIQNFLDPILEFDPHFDRLLEPNSDRCDFHVELEGIMHRDMDFEDLPRDPESQIQERVAQNLGVHPSRLRILESRPAAPTWDGESFGPLNVCLRMKLQIPDYVEQMTAWPEHALKEELIEFIQGLEDRPLGSSSDKTWATSGEFSDIVNTITTLFNPAATRGVAAVEWDYIYEEVLGIVRHYMEEHPHDATPTGLLKVLTEEFD